MKTIFAFDVGLGSLGEAVRKGNDIIHADSLLIDAGVADISAEATRRRQYRTRQTHKQRQQWWEKIWKEIGKEPLYGIRYANNKQHRLSGDKRLEREFPSKDDRTIYTSCLLRHLVLPLTHYYTSSDKRGKSKLVVDCISVVVAKALNLPWNEKCIGSTDDLYAKIYGISKEVALTMLDTCTFEQNPFEQMKPIDTPK